MSKVILPANPQRIEDLGDIPQKFKTTLISDNFLLYNSNNDDN